MRCVIVGMGLAPSRMTGGITPTIAHVPTGIVHPLPPVEDGFEKVPDFDRHPYRHYRHLLGESGRPGRQRAQRPGGLLSGVRATPDPAAGCAPVALLEA